MQVTLDQVELCDRVRGRAAKKTDQATVMRYRELLQCGAIFPPIVVFHEKGTERYVCADGAHRLEAAKGLKLQAEQLPVEVRDGDEIDALEFALSSNDAHGLPLTEKDYKFKLFTLLDTPKLASKYKTHRDKGELLHRSEKTIQRWVAEWRDSPGGNHHAKNGAKVRAEKHTAPPKQKEPEPAAPETRAATPPAKPPATPEQKKVAAEVRESVKRETAAPKANGKALPHAELSDFKRGYGAVAACPLDMADIAAKGNVDWAVVEAAADKLAKLLENR